MIVTGKLRNFVGSGGKFAAWIIFIASSAALLDLSLKGLMVGGILMSIALFVITAKDVLQLNTSTRKYRITSSFYGLHFGDWTPLPSIEKISVVASSMAEGAADGLSNSMSASRRVCAVRLHPGAGKQLIVTGRYSGKEKADEVAKLLSQELRITVVES